MTEADILDITRGWLKDYVLAAGEACHAHYAHHLQAGLAILSAVAGHKVDLPGYGGPQKPIVWNMIVGPPQETAKSTALGLASDVLQAYRKEMGKDQNTASIDPLLPEGVTKRVAVPMLQKHPSRLMIVDEFSYFLLEYSKDYHKGDIEWFKQLRDSRSAEQITRKYAREVVEAPCLSFLYGVTPTDLESFLTRQHRHAGYMARIYYTYVRERERTNTGLPEGIPYETMRDLVFGLQRIARIEGRASFEYVEDMWQVWNTYHPPWPDVFSGLRGRWRSATLTFMVLWELAANAWLKPCHDSANCAFKWAEYGNKTVNLLARDLVLYPPGPKRTVLQIIQDAYPQLITMAAISRQTDLTWPRLQAILTTLRNEGSAECTSKPGDPFSEWIAAAPDVLKPKEEEEEEPEPEGDVPF